MSAALDLKSAAALSQITEMKNCCLIGKCQHSRLQKTKSEEASPVLYIM